jgi:hypothetical protein
MFPTHLKMGQAVLEQRHLVSDLLAVSRFDHACFPRSSGETRTAIMGL